MKIGSKVWIVKRVKRDIWFEVSEAHWRLMKDVKELLLIFSAWIIWRYDADNIEKKDNLY